MLLISLISHIFKFSFEFRKLEYRDHVYFEPVCPSLILQFLKKNNPLYHDIDINLSNIPDRHTHHNKENETLVYCCYWCCCCIVVVI